MRKRRILILLIAFISIIIACLLLLLLGRLTNPICHELSQREIRSMFKLFTGRELPSKTENLRAIFHSYRGVEAIFLAFKTDQEGCSYILDSLGGQDVKMVEFPPEDSHPWQWSMVAFREGYRLQKKLGVVLFDIDLIDRIRRDELEQAKTGRYPNNAVTGYYLEFNANSKSAYYRVLVFKDRHLVYIFTEKHVRNQPGT